MGQYVIKLQYITNTVLLPNTASQTWPTLLRLVKHTWRTSIKSSKCRECSWPSFWYILLPVYLPVKKFVAISKWRPFWTFRNMKHSFNLTSDMKISSQIMPNKANLRDLIAATGLVILLKFDLIHRFFSLCDLEIWCMALKNNTAPLLYYIKICVSFQIHRWIQTKVTVRKRSIRVQIGDFLSCVTLRFDGWPWKTIGHLFYTTSSFVHHFIPIGDFKFQLQSGNAQFGSKSTIFLVVWPRNFMDDPPKQ